MAFYVDPELYYCRPKTAPSPAAAGCYDLLERLEIPFVRADHDHADTIEACHTVDSVLGCEICKNLFLCNRQQTAFYLLMMPGNKPFRTKDLSKQLEVARLSFATPSHMEQYLHLKPGSVSVLGLLYDTEKAVRLVIDRELLETPYISCHPCDSSSTLRLGMADFRTRLLPSLGHTPTFVTLPWEPQE